MELTQEEKDNRAAAAEAAQLKVKLRSTKPDEQAALIAGCNPCPDCGNMPHAIVQPRGVPGFGVIDTYEIGCLVDRDHRAVGLKREDAVKKWNAQDFLPPKDENGTPIPKEKQPLPT